MYISETQELALRREVSPALKRLKIGNPSEFASHKLSWDELHDKKIGLIKAARSLADRLSADDSDDTIKSVQAAHGGLLEIIDDIECEINQRSKIGDKSPRSSAGAHGKPPLSDAEFNGDGSPMHESRSDETLKLFKPEERFSSRTSSLNHDGLNNGQFLRSMIIGPKNEKEKRALAEGTDSSGGYTVPVALSNQLIDGLRASSVAIQAGAMTAPLTSDKNHVAKVLTDPTPLWRGELEEVGESDPTFGQVVFEPKSLAVMVRVSRELLEDSLNIETKLPELIQAAMARELDRVVFMGSGSGNQPSGLNVITGVQEIAVNDTIANVRYAPLLNARKSLKNQNVPLMTAAVMHPDIESEFGSLVDTTGQPLNYPSILDRPTPLNMLTSTQIPADLGAGSDESTIFCGDFSHLIIGIRSEIRIEVLKERFSSTLEYGFLAWMRADVVAVHPEAFVKLTGVQQ